MKKRILSIFLAAIILIGLVPFGSLKAVAAEPAVCKIGTTEYTTLNVALEAVVSGQTITMLNDITYSEEPCFIIDGKNVTIDFANHTLTVDTGASNPTKKNLFSIINSGNLTVKNSKIVCLGLYGSVLEPFNVKEDSKLTLDNVTQESNLAHFLTVAGGTAIINGGTFGANSGDVVLQLNNNAVLIINDNPTFNYQGDLIKIGASSNTDPDTNLANVTINSGAFNGANTAKLVNFYGKATVTINGGTFVSSNNLSSTFFISNNGYKSVVTINNLTSDSPYVFRSVNNSNVGSFTAIINNGHFKYTKGQFAIDSKNGLKPNINLVGGYYCPTETNDDAFRELNGFSAAGYQVNTLTDSDQEKVNGYSYKVEALNSPTPEPSPESNESGKTSDMETVNIDGATFTTWEEITANTPALTKEKLQKVNASNDVLLHVNIVGKEDKTVPFAAIQAMDKSSIGGLHIFVGESDAVTFLNALDYSNYKGKNFAHNDTITGNSRTIDFTDKGAINATVMFHTLISPYTKARIYKVVDGTEILIGTASSNEFGGFCFTVSELATYVIRF